MISVVFGAGAKIAQIPQKRTMRIATARGTRQSILDL